MNNVYVFSKIPNLLKELKIILPNINFREILSGIKFNIFLDIHNFDVIFS